MFLDARDIRKKYPGKWALCGVSFGAEKGRVTGLLGENGAGKSTLLRIIASVTRPTSGSVTVDGIPVGAVQVTSDLRPRRVDADTVVLEGTITIRLDRA